MAHAAGRSHACASPGMRDSLTFPPTMSAPLLGKQEINLLVTGFFLGFVLIGALTALGLSIGCVPSIWFGIPHQ